MRPDVEYRRHTDLSEVALFPLFPASLLPPFPLDPSLHAHLPLYGWPRPPRVSPLDGYGDEDAIIRAVLRHPMVRTKTQADGLTSANFSEEAFQKVP